MDKILYLKILRSKRIYNFLASYHIQDLRKLTTTMFIKANHN